MDKIKELKLNVTLSAVLTVILGLVLIIWPGEVVGVISKIIAIALILIGVSQLFGNFTNPGRQALGIVVSAIIIIVGVYLFINPTIILTVIPIIFGVLLVVHGVQDVGLAFEGRSVNAARWGLSVCLGVLSIILGAFCILNAFGLVKFAFMIFGFMLIYDGITDMLIVHRVNTAKKAFVDGEVLKEEDL